MVTSLECCFVRGTHKCRRFQLKKDGGYFRQRWPEIYGKWSSSHPGLDGGSEKNSGILFAPALLLRSCSLAKNGPPCPRGFTIPWSSSRSAAQGGSTGFLKGSIDGIYGGFLK